MSRIDTFNRALEAHLFINLYNRPDDETLRVRFDALSPEAQKQLVSLATPKPSHPEALDPELLSDAVLVAQHYAYRMIGSEQLPPFLRRAMLLADDSDSADVLLLSALTAASACMPNLRGSLLDEVVRPNLYTLVTGSAASGKGKATLCRRILDPIEAIHRIVIPGNSSATAMNEALDEYGGHGIIFETETDTLSHAFRLGGSFSSDLRKAFHGECISYRRRSNHEEVLIPDPQLSLFITGTPGQTQKLLHDAENGLFSRMLFYRLEGRKESFVIPAGDSLPATAIEHYYLALGYELRDLYLALGSRKSLCQFTLSNEQMQQFLGQFNNITNAYEELALTAYESETALNQMTSICRRMGNICYRLLMVMSTLRMIDQGALESAKQDCIGCQHDDFQSLVVWAEMLMHHTLIHYDELLMANGVVGNDEEEPDLDSPDLLNETQRRLWDVLPKSFIKKEAIQVAMELGLSTRTTERFLAMYASIEILINSSKGCYKKR